MRNLSRALVVAVALLTVGTAASTVFAGPLVVGNFTLRHPVQWNGTTLPAGDYQFKMTRTQSDVNMLLITGEKQMLNVMVFPQSACESCTNEALKMMVRGETRVVTAMEIPGYHLDFKAPHMENAKETADGSSSWVEQVSVETHGSK
jgi:hypothetical protein